MRVRLPGWARPVGPAAVLLAAVFVAVLASPDEMCTVGRPCGADWVGATGTMLLLPHLLSLVVLPELTLISTPLLLLHMAEPGQWRGGTAEKIADGVIVAALCWGGAAVAARFRTRRRRRSVILDAAGGIKVIAPAPDGFRPWQRGLIRYVVGALICAVAAALVTSIVLDDRATTVQPERPRRRRRGSSRTAVTTTPSRFDSPTEAAIGSTSAAPIAVSRPCGC